MSYPPADLRREVLSLFAEAQSRTKPRYSTGYGWHWFEPQNDVKTPIRRAYKTRKASEYEIRDLRMRMASGYRPKKWGRRLRAIALELDIEMPT